VSVIDDPAIRTGVVQMMECLTHLPHTDLDIKEYTEKFCDDTSALMFSFKNTIGKPIHVLVGKNILHEAGIKENNHDNLVGYAFCPEGGARTMGTILTFVSTDATKLLMAFACNATLTKHPVNTTKKNGISNKTI